MYEIDLLPVGTGTKSGDAITMRFAHPNPLNDDQVVIVIDGGYRDCGAEIVKHVVEYYGTERVDLVISTHPDQDHLNGLATVLEQLDVGELLIHRPRQHTRYAADYSNIECIDAVIAAALLRGVPVTEPFAGLQRFDGAVTVLSPTTEYYEELLNEDLSTSALASVGSFAKSAYRFAKAAVLAVLPGETLGEDGETTPRNNTSVVTYIATQDGESLLFTGDAGVPALHAALDVLDTWRPPALYPLNSFQAPHHGSRRNSSPSVLDRVLGPIGRPHRAGAVAHVSAAEEDTDHPSPKVTNALLRRGALVFDNGNSKFCHSAGRWPYRGWAAKPSIPPLDETSGDD
jgi:beta-lactamase superfamily II metal-dependent hydrolase